MSLPPAPPSRVFVELVPWADRGRENHPASDVEAQPVGRTAAREVHVSGSAEASASPNRAQVVVRVSSTKEAAAEAKKSVCRRLDYIMQSLQQQGLQAENVTVTKDFRRVENAYHMEAEVCITFTEFGKMQNICNFLVEKLDSSVFISPAQFYHTPGSVENLRRQACLLAVENAWRKAQEVCDLVGQTLGKPLLIKEEETKDWEGHMDDQQLSSIPVPKEVKRGHQISWNWSYRCLLAAMWVLGIKPRSSATSCLSSPNNYYFLKGRLLLPNVANTFVPTSRQVITYCPEKDASEDLMQPL